QWVMRPDTNVHYWEGERKVLADGLTLVCAGGHYAGGTVAHWKGGANGRGALLAGDIVMPVPDHRFVTFMWSYPNMIPLPAHTVEKMACRLGDYEFDAIYGPF